MKKQSDYKDDKLHAKNCISGKKGETFKPSLILVKASKYAHIFSSAIQCDCPSVDHYFLNL